LLAHVEFVIFNYFKDSFYLKREPIIFILTLRIFIACLKAFDQENLRFSVVCGVSYQKFSFEAIKVIKFKESG